VNSFNVKILDCGNLELSIDISDREELGELLQKLTENEILIELLEPYSCNSSFATVYDYGLTDAPAIIDYCIYDYDDANNLDYHQLWWFPNYMVESCMQTLHNNLRVVFQKTEQHYEKATKT
jgi:hypothetical protein